MSSIVVIDYGSQYTRLITRRLRELQVFSTIESPDVSPEVLRAHGARGVILSGGPQSVYAEGAPGLPDGLLDSGLPILAICYGMQVLARALGGDVAPSETREYGKAVLSSYEGALFDGVEGEFVAWMSHGDSVVTPPTGFVVTAATADTKVAAMEDLAAKRFALQFHPEVRHTPKGLQVLERFVAETGVARSWTPEHIIEEAVRSVRERVGDERVLLGISGGVDSSTLGLLLHRAVPTRLVAVFVDHGLLRLGEAEEVERALRSLGVDLTVVDASERFL
jgi:GMP synthase (glutamine-hydrolysing)